jgi:AcrR family transcriptional regulator
MKLQLSLDMGDQLALRDPQASTLGRSIVHNGLELMVELGYEQFTFKKLAERMGSTEAGIYRYFTNKHRLLLYLLTWYWSGLEYAISISNKNLDDKRKCVSNALDILVLGLPEEIDLFNLDTRKLYTLAVCESSKAYLLKDVDEINAHRLFMPYKSTVHQLALLFEQVNPDYPYAHSLATTVTEAAHNQHFFAEHLPSLTDFAGKEHTAPLLAFLNQLVQSVLDY